MYRHYFFDLDNTLAPSRQVADKEMVEQLKSVPDVVIVSGVEKKQLQKQFPDCPHYVLSQNGNLAYKEDFVFWEDKLSWVEKLDIFEYIESLIPERLDQKDLVEDRGCQISLSLVGHSAPIELKKAYDPNGDKRRRMLPSQKWKECTGIDCKIGGTTCLDFFKLGADKGKNILRFIERMGWDKNECVYYGDALFPGGNDESVLGVIDTIEVKNPQETLLKLKKIFE